MKKSGILNPEISELVARMGHGDMLVVSDRGFPLPLNPQVTVVDVSIAANLPRVVDVAKAVLEELEIEEVILAEETKKISPHIHRNERNDQDGRVNTICQYNPRFWCHILMRTGDEA